jgi:peptidoglycan/LPS O-acetylase OafA/YrhL
MLGGPTKGSVWGFPGDWGSAVSLGVDTQQRSVEAVEDHSSRPVPGDRIVLPHEPALDGLRGLAVAAVVLFHLERLDGGFLGVDLFFVLSGYLITSLLVTEHRGRGRIDLGRFWARRARRLLPALLLLIVGVGALIVRFTPESGRPAVRGDVLSTLGYVANWNRVLDTVSYWDMFNHRSPLDHTWSLAIEEQFYLVWPLVVLGLLGWWRRRGGADPHRRLGAVALAGAGASLVLLAVTYSPWDTNRAYFGTDTRLGPTLLGAALAVFLADRPHRLGAPSRGLELAGLAAVAWMAWSVLTVDGVTSWYYRGGLAAFALASVVVILVVTGGSPARRLSRLVSWRPLRGLGLISYGVYLWHWPVIVYVTADRAKVDGLALDVLRVVLTVGIGIAAASYVLVEHPIRRGALRGMPARLATGGGFAVALVVAVVATSGTAPASDIARPRRILGADNAFLHIPASVEPLPGVPPRPLG